MGEIRHEYDAVDEWLMNASDQMDYGYAAGFRGDELIGTHSECYLEGYEIGAAAKVSFEEEKKRALSTDG